MDETAAGVEAAARELVGRTLDDVRYYMLPYGLTDKPAWDEGVAHVAEYGLDLVTHGGTTGITWAPYGQFWYGLQLARGPVLSDLAPAGFCSVADEPPWSAVLGERITAARVHWLAVTWGQEEPHFLYLPPTCLATCSALEHRRGKTQGTLDLPGLSAALSPCDDEGARVLDQLLDSPR